MGFIGRKEKTNTFFQLYYEEGLKGVIVYECKYTKEKITSAIVNEEKRQLKECNVPYYQLGFFSKSGFDLQDKEDYLCYTLEDMFDL